MTPTTIAILSLIAWIFTGAGLFAVLSPRRAVLASYLGAWLFLPVAAVAVPGLPDLTKSSAASAAVLLGAVVFDSGRILGFRPSWIDIPMLAWCLAPIPSSVTNGLGLYDGVSGSLIHVVMWGIPYVVGRAYFTDLGALRDLAVAIVIGGVLYIPLCLFEVRMSPQLHHIVYGYHQHSFLQTLRWGGYRPMVFMHHGLMVGLWMVGAALAAFWLWRSRSVTRLFGAPMSVVTAGLGVTAVLCKSLGALGLGAAGGGLLVATGVVRARTMAWMLVIMAPAYMGVRTFGLWSGDHAVEAAALINPDRAQSLETRFENETLLIDKAMRQPLFGWGAWGRNRVYDEDGRDRTITDGLWVIVLGQRGVFGLAALTFALLTPVVLLWRRIPVRAWGEPAAGPAIVLAVLVVLHVLDSLLNAMINPIYLLAAGGIATTALALKRRPRRRRRSSPAGPRDAAPRPEAAHA